jgi:hypothetical protein
MFEKVHPEVYGVLQEGKNSIKITLINSLRNLLGHIIIPAGS